MPDTRNPELPSNIVQFPLKELPSDVLKKVLYRAQDSWLEARFRKDQIEVDRLERLIAELVEASK